MKQILKNNEKAIAQSKLNEINSYCQNCKPEDNNQIKYTLNNIIIENETRTMRFSHCPNNIYF